ncbi:MAG: sodium-dependent transporter [Chromatiales bacterium]|nr:sodium-dependent transporter [Chromatiales bacterium]
MAERRESLHGQWSGRWAFILAATGSAVGLGNIWKFPYITGDNGGGAFVIVYLVCIALIGIPVMMAEILLGRRGRRSPINTMTHLAEEEGRSPAWKLLGGGGIVAGFLILSFYSVVAGIVLAFFFRTASGVFEGQTADGVGALFGSLLGDPERLLAWHTIFMVMTTVVVARGVRSGLEQLVRYLMPALFILLIVMVGYAMNAEYAAGVARGVDTPFMSGLSFMFNPDFSKLSGDSVLIALGHAFFTLSLGMGAIMVYGSYLPQNTSIARTTITIALMDTVVALLAGLAIFPIVFANGLAPDQSFGLVFKTLPLAFGHMPGGIFFGSLFFLLLAFAAWTSAISLSEPVVAWLVENRSLSRIYAATVVGLITWVLGIASLLSLNVWSGYKIFGMPFIDLADYITANILLPLGGLLIAIFVGWKMKKESVADELAIKQTRAFDLWYVVIRYLSPIAIAIVLYLKIFKVI